MRDVAAVADSGPLIGLAKIDQLELLPALFAKVLVPPKAGRVGKQFYRLPTRKLI